MTAATAAIYFGRRNSAMAQDLGARVRNDGVKTLLMWGDKFRDERDVESSVRAVIIQKSMPNADHIANFYRRFAAGIEIHFVDDDGEFISATEQRPDTRPGDAPAEDPPADAGAEASGEPPSDAD